MIPRTLLIIACLVGFAHFPTPAVAKEPRLFELRTCWAAPGKLDVLHARTREHTFKLFEKHGMTNVGHWVPLDNPDRRIIFMLAHPSREARDRAWKEFNADPEWQKVRKASEAGGPLFTRGESTEFLTATDYCPPIQASKDGERVFELRTYTASPGNLDALNTRFRYHAVKLFRKHGMTGIGYWVPAQGQKSAENTLIYILAHPSVDAAKASWDAFRKDPDWLAARKESEAKAGGLLTVKDGVKSVFLKATDYSPIK